VQQQKGSKRLKSNLRKHVQIRPNGPQTRLNRAIARLSSSIVVTAEQACHAGGRGFESRRSRLSKFLLTRLPRLVVADLRALRVAPRVSFALVVRVGDPAAYIKHRTAPLLEKIGGLVFRPRPPFEQISFAIQDRAGAVVLAIKIENRRAGGTSETKWQIDPRYIDCARNLPWVDEIDPDGGASPCSAP
jgi:hypothetical protein